MCIRYWWPVGRVALCILVSSGCAAEPETSSLSDVVDRDATLPRDGASQDLASQYDGQGLGGVQIRVDLTVVDGPVRSLLGTNKDPKFLRERQSGTPFDATSLYAFMGIEEIRLHDSSLDLCKIFKAGVVDPAVNDCKAEGFDDYRTVWSVPSGAAADDPTHYDFTEADADVAAVIDAGAALYMRLGESYRGPNDTDTPEGWARVAERVFAHYRGEFKPSGVTPDIRAVEIGNEPDHDFWVGPPEGFYDIFRRTADLLRASPGPLPPIGGPGFTPSGVLTMDAGDASLEANFIGAVEASRLDFVSGHYYGQCGDTTAADAAHFLSEFRTSVDLQGAPQARLHITEWNIGLSECGTPFFRSARLRSFGGMFLTLMQDEGLDIDAAHHYAGVGLTITLISPKLMSVPEDIPVTGEASELVFNPIGWAFWAHKHLSGGQKHPVELCDASSCRTSLDAARDGGSTFAVVASRDGKVWGVVTNDSSQPAPVTLSFNGLDTTSVMTAMSLSAETAAGVSVATENGDDGLTYRPTPAALSGLESYVEGREVVGQQGRYSVTVDAQSLLVFSL